MASPTISKVAFANWKYKHYFSIVEVKGKNVYVTCNLCPGRKSLSASVASNSNLMKHLTSSHAATKIVAKNAGDNVSSATKGGDGAMTSKQIKLDFSPPQTLITQAELNKIISRYIVEDMLPLSTVESDSFRAIIAKIPAREGVSPPCKNTFSKCIDAEYAKMNAELKKTFEHVEYISTTADIWTAHNKSYLGVTAHWINPNSMEREKAALACRRFKGCHTHDVIAIELDNIHSSYGISHKITSTVTDNGSNFVKAFKRYQPVEEEDSEDDEDEVTFTDINDVLQNSGGDDGDGGEVVITLPPHQRCAAHTLNLVSCTDVDKWLLSKKHKQKQSTEALPQNVQAYGTRLVIQRWLQRPWMTSFQRSCWSLAVRDGIHFMMPWLGSVRFLWPS